MALTRDCKNKLVDVVAYWRPVEKIQVLSEVIRARKVMPSQLGCVAQVFLRSQIARL
jgi:hypothetical protein